MWKRTEEGSENVASDRELHQIKQEVNEKLTVLTQTTERLTRRMESEKNKSKHTGINKR